MNDTPIDTSKIIDTFHCSICRPKRTFSTQTPLRGFLEAIYGGDDAIIEAFRPFMLADRNGDPIVVLDNQKATFGTPEVFFFETKKKSEFFSHKNGVLRIESHLNF